MKQPLRWIPALALIATVSCYSPERAREWEVSVQAAADEAYPPGSLREEILGARGVPQESRDASEHSPSGYVAWAIRRAEADAGATVASWDFYLTPRRGGLGSSLGAFGLWGDYLLYTKEGVLIRARRRFLD